MGGSSRGLLECHRNSSRAASFSQKMQSRMPGRSYRNYQFNALYLFFFSSFLVPLKTHPCLVPPRFPLLTGNHYFVLYICESASFLLYSIICFISKKKFVLFYFLKSILFIYLVVLGLSCGMRTLSCSMRVGSSSLTRDRTQAPCMGSAES